MKYPSDRPRVDSISVAFIRFRFTFVSRTITGSRYPESILHFHGMKPEFRFACIAFTAS
ncbi:hypothetical protein HanIR_Chr03g0109891 [Helianthus annuus]|nr:hypothetical protein HanIR_Chr03g0109891 [Helianthus annuus]